jgi:hypothetical protein
VTELRSLAPCRESTRRVDLDEIVLAVLTVLLVEQLGDACRVDLLLRQPVLLPPSASEWDQTRPRGTAGPRGWLVAVLTGAGGQQTVGASPGLEHVTFACVIEQLDFVGGRARRGPLGGDQVVRLLDGGECVGDADQGSEQEGATHVHAVATCWYGGGCCSAACCRAAGLQLYGSTSLSGCPQLEPPRRAATAAAAAQQHRGGLLSDRRLLRRSSEAQNHGSTFHAPVFPKFY